VCVGFLTADSNGWWYINIFTKVWVYNIVGFYELKALWIINVNSYKRNRKMQWMELVNKVLTYWYSYFPPTWPDQDWFV